MSEAECDVVIIGAGAAGLATAIFAGRAMREAGRDASRIVLLDGATRIGAKILVSGGGRCNVTNARVTEGDYFSSGSMRLVRNVLAAFGTDDTLAWLAEMGVQTKLEEEFGKYFPVSDSAKTVVAALLAEVSRLGVRLLPGHRVTAVGREGAGYVVEATAAGGGVVFGSPRLVLATGGLSLPKTGSDGAGYAFATALGHSLVATTPALAPMTLGGSVLLGLSGIAVPVEIGLEGEKGEIAGPMLFTHFGISGPAAMNFSRVWHRAAMSGGVAGVRANFAGEGAEAVERRIVEAASRGRESLAVALAGAYRERMPTRVVEGLLAVAGVDGATALAHVSRDARRAAAAALSRAALPVTGSRGYGYAEVTAGGVPLSEVRTQSMESRLSPGLFLVGEILDCDGRIGGFNFQWAWATGFLAGRAVVG